MLRKHLKRFMPDRKKIVGYKPLRVFGRFIHDPNLWHMNRYSVATAFSVGLFCAWVPIPFQMVLAAALAIMFHANLPISAALVWLTNPVTMPPLFFFAYKIGAKILSVPTKPFNFELSFKWLVTQLQGTWKPFLLGCFILGVLSAIISNIVIRTLWRYFVIKNWNERKKRRKLTNTA